MVRHRTPRTRRRSQKRRLQLGGYDIPSPFKNTAELEAYIRAKLPQGLPSPGQKRGICGTDALAGGFYADGIRQLLWETLVFSQGANPRINTRRIETSGEVPDEEQVLFSILHRFAATQSTVRLTATAPGRFVRSETIRGDETAPVDLGEECNRIVVKFFKKVAGPSRENLAAYGGISHEDLGRAQHALIQYLGRKRGDEAIGGVSGADPSSNVYTPVAINLFVKHLDGSGPHETALVLIQGAWWFLDDNIGIAVPLLKPDGSGVTYGDLVSTQFKEVYESGHITLFLVYPDGREMQLNTTLPRLVKERAGTIGPLIEGRPRTFVYIKTAALTGAAPAPAPAPAVAGGRWVRATWATMMAETRANLDQFFATQCFPGSRFSAWPDAQSQEIWYYVSGTVKFAASVSEVRPAGGRKLSWVCTSQEARRTGLLGQFFSHLLAAYPETPGFRLVAADTNDQGLNLRARLAIYERYGFRLPPYPGQQITLDNGMVGTITDYVVAPGGKSYLYNKGTIASSRVQACAGEPGGCAMAASRDEMERAMPNWRTLVQQNPAVTATPAAPGPAPAPAPPAPAPPAPAPPAPPAPLPPAPAPAPAPAPVPAVPPPPPRLPFHDFPPQTLRSILPQDMSGLRDFEQIKSTINGMNRAGKSERADEQARLFNERYVSEVFTQMAIEGKWPQATIETFARAWLDAYAQAYANERAAYSALYRAESRTEKARDLAEHPLPPRAVHARLEGVKDIGGFVVPVTAMKGYFYRVSEDGYVHYEKTVSANPSGDSWLTMYTPQGPVKSRVDAEWIMDDARVKEPVLQVSRFWRDPPSTGGRRKTFRRRRSSLPKRTGPSSGHSRRYSRRRQASRS